MNKSVPIFPLSVISLIIAMAIGICSCEKSHEYPETIRPSLSQYQVEIPLGETVEIEVYGAEIISIEGSSHFVDITIDGSHVIFRGKTIGSGEVIIRGDGTPLRCCYEVYGGVDSSGDSDIIEEGYNTEGFARDLANDEIRFAYANQILKLETPGNIFSISTDNRILTATSLINGVEAKLLSQIPFTENMSSSNMSDHCNLLINGDNIGLRELRVANITIDRIWIYGRSTDGSVLWFVMEIAS